MALASLVNGRSSDEISLHDRGLQYGDGVFETIALENARLLCWDEHIARLRAACNQLHIPMPDEAVLVDEVSRLTQITKQGIIKIIITRGLGGRGYALPDTVAATRIISLYALGDCPHENATTGINARVCAYRYTQNQALAGIKHLNRLEQILARSEWDDDAIAEGIVLDRDDMVIEGTMSNIFYMAQEILYTPDLSACGINGIIRQKIIELAVDLNIEVCIRMTPLALLMTADEVFICNSIIGLWPIKMIDAQSFPVGDKTHKIRQTLQKRHIIPTPC